MRKTVSLGGRRYTISDDARLTHDDGWCCTKTRQIRLNRDLYKRGDYLETLVHEALHAEFPFLAEEEVLRAGKNLAVLIETFKGRIWRGET